jgi:hypothetical protein
MTTIVDIDMTPEFQEELQEKLVYWHGQHEGLLAQLNELNAINYNDITIDDIERMDELQNVFGPKIQSKIEEIVATLEAIENQKKKKFDQLKFAIEEQSLRMMYHPTRVARLLDSGLVSFVEGGSFDNL